MPQSASTTGAPASSSSPPPSSSHNKSVKAHTVTQAPAKVQSASSAATSTGKRPVQVKPTGPTVLQKGPVALKPSTRKPAPLNNLSPAAVAVASTSQRSPPPHQQPPADVMTMSAVISPAPTPDAPIMSMTSKEWVIPPRPKPGRKPATDTPPTKRKAQNRAAQRAFRERRAARVGELEEQLDQQKGESDQREATYKDTIRDLELEVQSYRSRCLLLENMLERERKERLQAETSLETMRRQSESRPVLRTANLPDPNYHSPFTGGQQQQSSNQQHNSRQSPPRTSRQDSNTLPPITNTPSGAAPNQGYFDTDASLTCGNCEPSGRCACVEEVLNTGCGNCGAGGSCKCAEEADAVLSRGPILKRSASPIGVTPIQKRARSSLDADSPVEVDFTTTFQRRQAIETSQSSQFESSGAISGPPSLDNTFLKDDCGFCKDGTYCVCADTAMATPAMTPVDTLPPISSQTRTPPPSETDVVSTPFIMEMTAEGAVKLPRRNNKKKTATQAASGGCGSGAPGTCAQCRADPKSGLFCRLMAANFSKGEGGGGCCGGKGAGGGCCKSKPASSIPSTPAPPVKEKITLPSLPSLGLSCAEAYQTLASHRNFDRAADDIGSWLPKLRTTTPQGRATTAAAKGGKMGPIEVEAASIMSVLKDFDVRFGREA